jgi:glycosyltransferase involved in cell wall biosynthesis
LFAVQYPKPLVPFLNLLERVTASIHRDTIVMARTREWQKAFPRIGFKPENIRVVPACISQEWLVDGNDRLVRQPRIVWLGKFRRYKCPDHAIRAMGTVVKNIPGARLILAGYHDDRGYEEELVKLVERLDLNSAIEFRFGISADEKFTLLDSARALVLPSTVEGFGIVVLEANARRVPVIASSGVPTGAVENGRNGLRYPFGDIDALAEAMTLIATNDDLHRNLADQSLAFARQFEWRTVCRQYEAVLFEATDRHFVQRQPASQAER